MRLLLIGIWAALVATLSSAGASVWLARQAAAPGEQGGHDVGPVAHDGHGASALQQVKIRSISVPMLAEGAVQGYIVAQFTLVSDGAALKAAPLPPEPYVLDEAFRQIFLSRTIDFRNLASFDMKPLTDAIAARLRERLGPDLVKDLLVQEFTFVSRADIRR